MLNRPVRIGLRLGLFQLSLGILGVITLGLLNRLLIEEIQLPAVMAALAIGAQEMMGFTRAFFGKWSDRLPVGRLRRTPFLLISSLSLSLLLVGVVWVVLQLAITTQGGASPDGVTLVILLVLLFVGIGVAVCAGGTAFSALVVDLTSERERTRVLSVVWSLRLFGVMLGTLLVNRLFGSACETGASRVDVLLGLERLMVVAPSIMFVLGLVAVIGIEKPSETAEAQEDARQPLNLSLTQLLRSVFSVPQAKRFTLVMCLFTFSMFLNDSVLEPYGAAIFGMNICATTSLNALLAFCFLAGLLISGFLIVPSLGMVRGSQSGALLASLALVLMIFAAPDQLQNLLRLAIGMFGLSLGICIHSCFNLMFNFVQPGLNAVLLGVWGVGYTYSRGLATMSGGGLLTLLNTVTSGNELAAFGGVFGFQIVLFLVAALLMNYLDVSEFRSRLDVSLKETVRLMSD